jgi:hypothetical protein
MEINIIRQLKEILHEIRHWNILAQEKLEQQGYVNTVMTNYDV